MLIYLDANIVQYTADYAGFIFGNQAICPADESGIRKELYALRELVELEQLGSWTFANCEHLQAELHRGRPSNDQLETYEMLNQRARFSCMRKNAGFLALSEQAYIYSRIAHGHLADSADGEYAIDENIFRDALEDQLVLKLRDRADRMHLATAVAMGASWFLTNDNEIIRKVGRRIRSTSIARPSECIREISVGLFLR